MLEFISDYWWIWVAIFLGSMIPVCYYRYKAYKSRQKRDFIVVTTTALVGCLIAGFSVIGAISALLSIIAAIMKIIAWKITGG